MASSLVSSTPPPSITVFNCIRNLNQLRKQNHVSIAWISGHAGVHGIEVADYVAKSGSKSKILYMVLNFLLQSRMPAVLARLRTGPQIDGNLCGMNGRTLEDDGVCWLDVFTTNNTSP